MPDGSPSVAVMDFSEPFPLDPLPPGWYHRKFLTRSPMTFSFATVQGVHALRLETDDSASMLFRRVDVEIDVPPVDVQAGDQFLLCSDGLSGVLSDPEIAAVLQREPPEKAVRMLVDFANARGGPDNVTVMATAVPFCTAAAPHVPAGAARREWALERALAGRRKVRRIAAAATIIASLLAVALLLLVVTSLEAPVEDPRVQTPVGGDVGAATPDVATPPLIQDGPHDRSEPQPETPPPRSEE